MLYVCRECDAKINSYQKLSECDNCGFKFKEIKYFKPLYIRSKVECKDCNAIFLINLKDNDKGKCVYCNSNKLQANSPIIATSLREWRKDRNYNARKKIQTRIQKTTTQLVSDLNLLGVAKGVRRDIDKAIRDAVSAVTANG